MERSRLTNLELYKEDDNYYLKAEYEVENDHRLQKYTFPKLYLPIGDRFNVNQSIRNHMYCSYNGTSINFGDFELEALPDGECIYKMETLKEYPQKMTLEEIEKKLGYKVELVSGA